MRDPPPLDPSDPTTKGKMGFRLLNVGTRVPKLELTDFSRAIVTVPHEYGEGKEQEWEQT